MIHIASASWSIDIPLSVIIAGLAFLVSLANFGLIVWDRRPHLTVGIENEQTYGYDDELGYEPEGYRLWIDIVNRSPRRIKVSHFTVHWKRTRFSRLWLQTSELPDVQPGDPTIPDLTRFWIEPWGDAVFSLDSEELAARLKKRSDHSTVWISAAATDVTDRSFRSNVLALKIR